MSGDKTQITFLDPGKTIFSYSQLSTFKNCKEQYKKGKYKRIRRIHGRNIKTN